MFRHAGVCLNIHSHDRVLRTYLDDPRSSLLWTQEKSTSVDQRSKFSLALLPGEAVRGQYYAYDTEDAVYGGRELKLMIKPEFYWLVGRWCKILFWLNEVTVCVLKNRDKRRETQEIAYHTLSTVPTGSSFFAHSSYAHFSQNAL